jgi:hypothetical protein
MREGNDETEAVGVTASCCKRDKYRGEWGGRRGKGGSQGEGDKERESREGRSDRGSGSTYNVRENMRGLKTCLW